MKKSLITAVLCLTGCTMVIPDRTYEVVEVRTGATYEYRYTLRPTCPTDAAERYTICIESDSVLMVGDLWTPLSSGK